MQILSDIKENLIEALNVSWKGLLSLFIAMTVLYFVIVILNKLTNKNKK